MIYFVESERYQYVCGNSENCVSISFRYEQELVTYGANIEALVVEL